MNAMLRKHRPAGETQAAPQSHDSALQSCRTRQKAVNWRLILISAAWGSALVSIFKLFYLFYLLIAHGSYREDAPAALWTFIATSFGLTIAAVVQAGQSTLTLFQALQVSNLVWLANFGTFLSLASYSRKRAKAKGIKHKADNHVKLGAMMQTLFSMVLTLYMWGDARLFTNEQPCEVGAVQYVLFAWNIRAAGPGRIVGLVVSSILTLLYLGVTLHELHSFRRSHKEGKHSKKKRRVLDAVNLAVPASGTASPITPSSTHPFKLEHPSPILPMFPSPSQASESRLTASSYRRASPSTPSHENHSPANVVGEKRRRRPGRRQWFADLDPMLLGIGTFQIVVFTYFIVSSERLIINNNTDGLANQISAFGQILALIVVVPSAFSVYTAFREHGVRRLHRSNRSRHRRSRSHRSRREKAQEPPPRLEITAASETV